MATRFALNILVVFVAINVAFADSRCNTERYWVNVRQFKDNNEIKGYVEGMRTNLARPPGDYYHFTDDIFKNYGTPLFVRLIMNKEGTIWKASMSPVQPIAGCHDLLTMTSGKDRDETFRRVFTEFFKKFQ